MAKRDSKDVADALAALAAGHHEEPEVDADHHDAVVPAQNAAPPPAAPRPAPAVPPANPVRRNNAAPQGTVLIQGKTPVAPPKKPQVKQEDPVSHYADAVAHLSAEDPAEAEQAKADSEVIAPAPTMDAFKPHYRTAVARKKKDPVENRRTLIPILLTVGAILVLMAATVLALGSDSAVSGFISMGGAVGLLVAGVISLGLAAMNMIYVKNALERRGK